MNTTQRPRPARAFSSHVHLLRLSLNRLNSPNVSASTPTTLTPLASLRVGQVALVREALVDAADAAYLRAMGLRPGSHVRICRLGEPVIIEVSGCGLSGCDTIGGCGCRIGLSREIARKVMVEPTPEPARHG